MAVPKQKVSRARKGRRNANRGLRRPSVGICPQCRSGRPSHRACPVCGSYAGRDALRAEK
jgi:large subunit ribosomal protein L32